MINELRCLPLLIIFATLVAISCGSDNTRTQSTTWPDGSVKERWQEQKLDDGSFDRQGRYRSRFEDGRLNEEGNYEAGQKTGKWTTWYGTEPNKKRMEGEFLKGEMHGTWHYWMNHDHAAMMAHADSMRSDSSNDTASMAHHYNADSAAVSDSGDSARGTPETAEHRPHKREEYSHGKPNGIFISWHPDGQVADSMGYVDGLLHGTYKLYHQNGQIATEAVYDMGARQGAQTFFGEDGSVIRREE